jgi:hypothetical protein
VEIDKDFSAKNPEKVKTMKNYRAIKKNSKSVKQDEYIAETGEVIKEAGDRVQRAIAKEQIVLTGLETLKKSIFTFEDSELNKQFIEDVIEKSRFENEHVLDTYRPVLLSIISKRNTDLIDTIIERVKGTMRSLTGELNKNEIIRQNLESVSFSRELENPEELMKKVISDLKKNNIPQFNFKRSRILDLLNE